MVPGKLQARREKEFQGWHSYLLVGVTLEQISLLHSGKGL